MNKNTLTIGGIGLILLIIFANYFLFSSPEKQIRKRLNDLAGTIEIQPQDGTIKKAAQISSIGGYFTSDVELHIETPRRSVRASSRADIVSNFKYYKGDSRINSLSLSWDPLNPIIEPGPPKKAQVQTSIEITYNGQPRWVQAAVNIELIKEDGKWKISKLKTQ